jgi:hypothetical protein
VTVVSLGAEFCRSGGRRLRGTGSSGQTSNSPEGTRSLHCFTVRCLSFKRSHLIGAQRGLAVQSTRAARRVQWE